VYTKRPESVDVEWRPLSQRVRPVPPDAPGKPNENLLARLKNGALVKFNTREQVTDLLPALLRKLTEPAT
jgi:hypothetical protein